MKILYTVFSLFTFLFVYLYSAAFFSAYGPAMDPEGMGTAIIALVFIGPIVSGVLAYSLIRLYKKHKDDKQMIERIIGIMGLFILISFFGLSYGS